MKKIAVVLFGILAIALAGCDSSEPSEPSVVQKKQVQVVERYDMSAVVTVGNHSYLPLNLPGNPSQHVSLILGALQAFEKAHPEWRITGWRIEKRQAGYAVQAYIFGLWVDHE